MKLIGKTVKDIMLDDEENKNKEEEKNSLNYLLSTDWYIIRYTETGEKIPEEIIEKRRKAREKISLINNNKKFKEEAK